MAPRRRIAAGRPKPLNLSGAILLAPESVMVLEGRSLRGLFQEAGELSLFRGFEGALHAGQADIPPGLAKRITAIAEKVPPSPLQDLVIRAFGQRDPAARAELGEMGQWAVFQVSWFENAPEDQPRWTEQFVEIEGASKGADQHLRNCDFVSAAAALSLDPRLRAYLTDQALASLAAATDQVDALPSRTAGALEVLLSNVAWVDIATRAIRSSNESFDWLLETGPDGQCNPGRQFTRRMVERLGPGTLEGLLEQAIDPAYPSRQFVDLSTLKRWNRGEIFPSQKKVDRLVKAILKIRMSDAEAKVELARLGNAFGAARRMHKCLELVRMPEKPPLLGGRPAGVMRLLRSDSPEAWARTRYAFWLKHWQSQKTTT